MYKGKQMQLYGHLWICNACSTHSQQVLEVKLISCVHVLSPTGMHHISGYVTPGRCNYFEEKMENCLRTLQQVPHWCLLDEVMSD